MKKAALYSSILILSTILFACLQSDTEGEDSISYQEPHRPQFHFSPDSMWMNDPNGMVYFDGEYHLFYQHYPQDNVWGPMHWGHAVSSDLVHWEHLPVALYPDSLGYIFSGSAVIDRNNTSGLQQGDVPPMIAIFTYHNMEGEKAGSNTFQTQGIAYSNDKGRTWTKYSGNPVIENPGIRDFRDPKVSWFEKENKWIMVFAAYDRVMFYSSPDLINWTKESEFGVDAGAHGGVWECPDLFPLDYSGEEKWVLLVSINPGGVNGGSCTQYFVGNFDGTTFTAENPVQNPSWLDYGKDNYAGVTFSDIPDDDGRRILIGWMSNWQYATVVPTERWRSAMTIPRELILVKRGDLFKVISSPVSELAKLRRDSMTIQPSVLSGPVTILSEESDYPASMYELLLTFKISTASQFGIASEFGIEISNSEGEKLTVGYHTAQEQLYIDRKESGDTGFSDEFGKVQTAPLKMDPSGNLKMHLYIDKSSVEVFVNDGELVMTSIFFPGSDFNTLSLFTKNGNIKLSNGTIYSLESAW